MKKFLSSTAIILSAITLAGCSAQDTNLGSAPSGKSDFVNSTAPSFKGTDIGGTGSGSDLREEFTEEVCDGLADIATGGGIADAAADDFAPIDVISPEEPSYPEPQAGMLTGGEWNDNAHWADWNALYSTHDDWNSYKSAWKNQTDNRIAVKITADGEPVEGAKVSCNSAICSAVTDNKGMAYLFYTAINGKTDEIVVEYDGISTTFDGVTGNAELDCKFSGVSPEKINALDFMIMCDTTGSMSDELEYLKVELESIVRKVSTQNSNIQIRTSVNFYRDEGDEYVVRQFPFTADIEQSVDAIGKQCSDGGGDTPEAVHTALDSAINNHDWDDNSVKIMFLVLDAPPHSDEQIISEVNKHIREAAEKGIRIVPIASSGVDKSTEYLLRTMAFTTGGTYTFLTDDSGIGNAHIEPTVGAYNVEKLSDMMVRIVNSYLA